MRKFSSYGPVNTRLHYYVPRQELVDRAYTQLVGEDPTEGGHYITVWAPRQTGKTWVMQQVLWRLWEDEQFDALKLNLEHLKTETDVDGIAQTIAAEIVKRLSLADVSVHTVKEFDRVFELGVLRKPLVLILDEFDALGEEAIAGLAGVLRNLYHTRRDDPRPSAEKAYLLHGVALIGVRAVLGFESTRGSPFNVQRSLHVPNLTADEVQAMFRWYERESGQPVEQAVIDRVFYETRGQPGLVSWLGELLTETYNRPDKPPLTPVYFEEVYSAALDVLPNNNILNIISKARQAPYQDLVLELFRTGEPMRFTYDDPLLNYLYLNGVIDWEQVGPAERSVRFPCPFVQKRLFNYFARTLFREGGQLYGPFADLSDTITETALHVRPLLRRYETYLRENRSWLLRDVPRRVTDLRPYEAVYHFNLYAYLERFLQRWRGQILPEFPTGNGKVDLLLRHAGRVYGLEVKSFVDAYTYRESLRQAARYAQQLGPVLSGVEGLTEIVLALFVEAVDDANRARYEVAYVDAETGVTVTPVFVETG